MINVSLFLLSERKSTSFRHFIVCTLHSLSLSVKSEPELRKCRAWLSLSLLHLLFTNLADFVASLASVLYVSLLRLPIPTKALPLPSLFIGDHGALILLLLLRLPPSLLNSGPGRPCLLPMSLDLRPGPLPFPTAPMMPPTTLCSTRLSLEPCLASGTSSIYTSIYTISRYFHLNWSYSLFCLSLLLL